MLGVELGLGLAVGAASCDRKDLDDKGRRPFDSPFGYDATAIVANENKIGLDYGCGSKNPISRRCINIAELIG